MTAKTDQIRDFLLQGLLATPARAGMRLKSEPELAVLLKTKRGRVRLVIDELVASGVLSRQSGSGTFLRKVPHLPTGAPAPSLPSFLATINPALIFAETTPQSNHQRRPRQENRTLNLALVADHRFRDTSPSFTYRSILSGMKERAQRDHHRFIQIDIASDEFSREVADDLVRQLDTNALDGCLVRAVKGDWIDDILKERNIPRAHFSDFRTPEIPHPCIMLDPTDALRSALLQLHGEGCRRIGHFELAGRLLAPGIRECFVSTMNQLGLPAGRAEYLELEPEQILQGVRRMLAFDQPPDGVYVGDDVLLHHLVPAWKKCHVKPGKDFSVITLACRGNPLPGKLEWSRMEFDPYQVGRMAMDTLLQSIQTVEGELCSFVHVAAYIAGATTRRVRP